MLFLFYNFLSALFELENQFPRSLWFRGQKNMTRCSLVLICCLVFSNLDHVVLTIAWCLGRNSKILGCDFGFLILLQYLLLLLNNLYRILCYIYFSRSFIQSRLHFLVGVYFALWWTPWGLRCSILSVLLFHRLIRYLFSILP